MKRPAEILLVDDDELVQLMVEDIITQLGHHCTIAADGQSARQTLTRRQFDLVILDRRLPDVDGLLLTPLLKNDRKQPFIVLSSLDGATDQVLGFDMGAIDYICKPVEPLVLRARIQAHLSARRESADENDDNLLSVGNALRLDVLSRRLRVGGRTEILSPAETRLLICLIQNLNIPCDRSLISEAICGREWVYGDRTVDVLISRLRRRLRGADARIITVHGLGYALTETAD
ncbi:MAG: response regulator transcription factor [Lautropia sp.]|nr:response regulator transcription factor [Lautropia sp.]